MARMACETHGSTNQSQYERDNADLLVRLRKIEGQVRGIQRMVVEDRYCIDVLTQLAAIRASVNAVARSLLDSHVRGCVAGALRSGGDGAEHAVAELSEVMGRFCH